MIADTLISDEDIRLESEKLSTMDQPAALGRLGYLYLNGLGVELDFDQFTYWCQKAAKLSHPQPSIFYFSGEGLPQDKEGARHWWQIACGICSADACELLNN